MSAPCAIMARAEWLTRLALAGLARSTRMEPCSGRPETKIGHSKIKSGHFGESGPKTGHYRGKCHRPSDHAGDT
jgi:hypothetical protein